MQAFLPAALKKLEETVEMLGGVSQLTRLDTREH
jgi:hypothetical protein